MFNLFFSICAHPIHGGEESLDINGDITLSRHQAPCSSGYGMYQHEWTGSVVLCGSHLHDTELFFPALLPHPGVSRKYRLSF